MALPAIESLQPADVLLPRWLVPVLELAALPGEAIPLDGGGRGMVAAAGELRRRGYGRGVLLAPSFSAALIFLLGGVRARRGARTDGRGLLVTEPVPDAAMAGLHRAATYHVLARGAVPEPLPAPRLQVPERLRAAWAALLADHGGRARGQDGITVGLFPGSNAESRRWEGPRFAELARRQAAAGARVVVFGGAGGGERELTRAVAGDVAFDAGGRTDLPLLAAGLAACDLLVTNDSGPMHLAAAVGTRTVSLQGPSDPRRTRPLGEGHVLVQHGELPCVPCVRNHCPRSGAGTILPEAKQECLRLITVDEVEGAVGAAAAGARH